MSEATCGDGAHDDRPYSAPAALRSPGLMTPPLGQEANPQEDIEHAQYYSLFAENHSALQNHRMPRPKYSGYFSRGSRVPTDEALECFLSSARRKCAILQARRKEQHHDPCALEANTAASSEATANATEPLIKSPIEAAQRIQAAFRKHLAVSGGQRTLALVHLWNALNRGQLRSKPPCDDSCLDTPLGKCRCVMTWVLEYEYALQVDNMARRLVVDRSRASSRCDPKAVLRLALRRCVLTESELMEVVAVAPDPNDSALEEICQSGSRASSSSSSHCGTYRAWFEKLLRGAANVHVCCRHAKGLLTFLRKAPCEAPSSPTQEEKENGKGVSAANPGASRSSSSSSGGPGHTKAQPAAAPRRTVHFEEPTPLSWYAGNPSKEAVQQATAVPSLTQMPSLPDGFVSKVVEPLDEWHWPRDKMKYLKQQDEDDEDVSSIEWDVDSEEEREAERMARHKRVTRLVENSVKGLIEEKEDEAVETSAGTAAPGAAENGPKSGTSSLHPSLRTLWGHSEGAAEPSEVLPMNCAPISRSTHGSIDCERRIIVKRGDCTDVCVICELPDATPLVRCCCGNAVHPACAYAPPPPSCVHHGATDAALIQCCSSCHA